MKSLESSVFWLKVAGNVLMTAGVACLANYYFMSWRYSLPQDMGIILGSSAIALTGCATSWIAKVLKQIADRLEAPDGTSDRKRLNQ